MHTHTHISSKHSKYTTNGSHILHEKPHAHKQLCLGSVVSDGIAAQTVIKLTLHKPKSEWHAAAAGWLHPAASSSEVSEDAIGSHADWQQAPPYFLVIRNCKEITHSGKFGSQTRAALTPIPWLICTQQTELNRNIAATN